MKGITPVIAIILLLLMTVAAAGGFYFFYQRFTSEGEDSGARQMEQLADQTLARVTIESAAQGRIYIRNTGATSLDLSQLTIYVNNVPVSADISAATLAEGERATIHLTELPQCTDENCEVRISGAAADTRTVRLSALVCSTDADCRSSDVCYNGICREIGFCGDGICGEEEDGSSCYQDCGPRSLPNMILVGENNFDIYQFDWDGETYVQGASLIEDENMNVFFDLKFDSDGNGMFTGFHPNNPDGIIYSYFDGDSWAQVSKLETFIDDAFRPFSMVSFLSDGTAVMGWSTATNITSANYTHGSGWTEPIALTPESDLGRIATTKCYDLTESMGSEFCNILYTTNLPGDTSLNQTMWMSSMGAPWGNMVFINSLGFTPTGRIIPDITMNSTDYLIFWNEYHGAITSINYTHGIVGTPVEGLYTIEDGQETVFGIQAFNDIDDNMILVAHHSVGPSPDSMWAEYYTRDAGESEWIYQGNFTEENPTGFTQIVQNENGAITATFNDLETTYYTYWTGSNWAELVEFE